MVGIQIPQRLAVVAVAVAVAIVQLPPARVQLRPGTALPVPAAAACLSAAVPGAEQEVKLSQQVAAAAAGEQDLLPVKHPASLVRNAAAAGLVLEEEAEGSKDSRHK